MAGAQVIQLSKVLNSRRKELDDFRRATFESYAAQHPPPPSYDAIAIPTPPPTSPPTSPPFPTPEVGPSIESIQEDKPLPPAPLIQSPQLEPFVPIGVPSPTTTQPGFRPVEWGSSKSSRKRQAISYLQLTDEIYLEEIHTLLLWPSRPGRCPSIRRLICFLWLRDFLLCWYIQDTALGRNKLGLAEAERWRRISAAVDQKESVMIQLGRDATSNN